MALDEENTSTERELTDKSLRLEREKADRALAERRSARERDADSVVDRARGNADAILTAARDRADQGLGQSALAVEQRATIAEARQLEDAALQRERDSADESLRRERAHNARALAGLLPLEREKTDRNLLTERARSDDALSHRDDFLGIVSHDLRNLLSGIVMSATLIPDREPEDEGTKKLARTKHRILRYAARMNGLIGDLVDVASIAAGKLAVAPAPGDATALIGEALEMFQPAAAAKKITLDAEAVGMPLEARFDHDRLIQVLVNLITNAIKFTDEGGRIWIKGDRDRDGARFSVSDSGSGIPNTMLEAVFERFWQVGKNDRRGLGLGLYISRCIIEAHGGKIWAESQPGEGSTFSFTLPDAHTVTPPLP